MVCVAASAAPIFETGADAGNPGWGADEMFAAFRDVECASCWRRCTGAKGPLNLFVPGKPCIADPQSV